MIFFHFLLPLFAAAFSFVVSSPTAPSLHHVSPRGPGRKIVGDIPIPSSPRIREWVNRFREMLPARQNGDTDNPNVDTAEIRQRYMIRPQRRYPHAVFYVNQRRTETMNDANPNWGTNRALQLRSLLEAELARRGDPNPESWTLYQAYDCPDAFGIIDEANNLDYPSDIRRAALSLNEERDWFRHTSAAFAEMVQGTVYLVVEEGEDAIGSDSIWRTHELPAIIRSQEVDEILEVRPANIGEALEGSRPLVLLGYRDPDAIRRQPTHGEPIPPVTTPEPVPPGVPGPPGPPPPPQSPPHREPPDHDSLKRGENPINVTIDPKKALEARRFPEIDLSNAVDFTPTPDPPPPPPKPPAPYQEGQCSIHLSQWKNPTSGGGSPFDNPGDTQWTGPFSIEVTMRDGRGTQIGYVPRTNANDPNALEMASKLEDKLRMTPEEWNDYIQFDLAQQHWKSSDQDHCTVGGYDRDQKREMDCHFGCYYGGRSSSDGTPAPQAAGIAAAGGAVVNAAADNSDVPLETDGTFDKWRDVIIGLVIANFVIALALVAFNIIGRWSGRHKSTMKTLGDTHASPGLYRPVYKQDNEHDMEEVPFRSPSYT